MVFEWTAHRFSGGILAFDLVNTVVCRSDPARRADRFSTPEHVTAFAEAASVFRAAETGDKPLIAPRSSCELEQLVCLREAVNDWARPLAAGQNDSGPALSRLFSAAAACTLERRSGGCESLAAAAAISAMRLVAPEGMVRTRICPNCDWLFMDRSKNGSRRWCDMAVCGNRAKAKSHYRRKAASLVKGEACL